MPCKHDTHGLCRNVRFIHAEAPCCVLCTLPRWSTAASTWGGSFLQPLATTLKTELLPPGSSSHTTVFSSPYAVGNRTRRPASHGDLDPSRNAAVWADVFTQWAPALDLVAPQDAMGAQGNSFELGSEYAGRKGRWEGGVHVLLNVSPCVWERRQCGVRAGAHSL